MEILSLTQWWTIGTITSVNWVWLIQDSPGSWIKALQPVEFLSQDLLDKQGDTGVLLPDEPIGMFGSKVICMFTANLGNIAIVDVPCSSIDDVQTPTTPPPYSDDDDDAAASSQAACGASTAACGASTESPP